MADNAEASAALYRLSSDNKNEKLDSKNELLDAKTENTSSSKKQNAYLTQKTANAVKQLSNLKSAVSSDQTAVSRAKSALSKFKSTASNKKLLSEIKSYIKAHPKQVISAALLSKAADFAATDGGELFGACAAYNAAVLQLQADQDDYNLLSVQTSTQQKEAVSQKIQNVSDEYAAKKENSTDYLSKNKLIDSEIKALDDTVLEYANAKNTNQKNANRYSQKITSVKATKSNKKVLSEIKAYIKQNPYKTISSGLLNQAKKLNDQRLYNYCVKYNHYVSGYISDKELYELASTSAKKTKTELAVEKMENIEDGYAQKIQKNESAASVISAKIAQIQASTGKVTAALYKEQLTYSRQKLELLKKERAEQQAALEASLSAGIINRDSKEYNDWINAINDITSSIYDEMAAEEEYYDSMIQTRIDGLNDVLEILNKMNDANERAITLQKAKYNLERALNQRTQQVLTQDGFLYTADQTTIDDAREELRDVSYQEIINKIEDVIEELEKLQEESGLYDADGNLTEAGKDILQSLHNIDSQYIDTVKKLLENTGYNIDWSSISGFDTDSQDKISFTALPKIVQLSNPGNNLKIPEYHPLTDTTIQNNTTLQFNGNLSFPNIKSGNDAEALINELKRLRIDNQQFLSKKSNLRERAYRSCAFQKGINHGNQ